MGYHKKLLNLMKIQSFAFADPFHSTLHILKLLHFSKVPQSQLTEKQSKRMEIHGLSFKKCLCKYRVYIHRDFKFKYFKNQTIE